MARLTDTKKELLGQFADGSFENPSLTFAQVAKELGAKFPATAAGRPFKREAQKIFDRERSGRAD